jgi:hypothetical protein
MKVFRLAFVVTALTLWGAPLRAATIFGIDFAGQVIGINTSTGVGTLIGASGVSATSSLASNNSGVFYTVDAVGSARLDTINPGSGLATTGPFVTGLGAFTFLNGLAFSSSGVLYADAETTSGPLTTNLFTIDTTTGVATSIGVITVGAITDLAFGPSGTLYAWDVAGGLRTVNTSTGAGTLVQSGLSGLPDIRGLRFDANGTLYAAGFTDFYTIDPTTSAPTFIGTPGFSDIRGLAFASVPEPSTLTALVIGLIALAAVNRRKRLFHNCPE